MIWTIEFSAFAVKQLKKLDKPIRVRIFDYVESRVCTADDPKKQGKALGYNKAGLWCYRVGDYRIICQIKDESATILILSLGHRSEVYR